MEYKFTINGRLPGINEYTAANRRNPHCGGAMKKDGETIAICSIRRSFRGLHINKPIKIKYLFYEQNERRDLDNIAGFAHKVIQDALVKSHVINNDGWKNIQGFSDDFCVDKDNPRIEVTLIEQEVKSS